MDHFLVWLRRKREGLLSETKIGETSGQLPLDTSTHAEAAIFHVLACLYSEGDLVWTAQQREYLDRLDAVPKRHTRPSVTFAVNECEMFARNLGLPVSDECLPVLASALGSLSLAIQLQPNLAHFIPWIRSLTAPNVTGACLALENLMELPAFVVTDILLRTPLTAQELRLQLDLWHRQMASVAVAYFNRPSHVRLVVDNLLFYTVHYDPTQVGVLVNSSLSSLTSTSLGYKFLIMTDVYVNTLIYNMATYTLRNGFDVLNSPDHEDVPDTVVSTTNEGSSLNSSEVVRAQENLAKFLVRKNALSQIGYLGIVLAIADSDKHQAKRLFQIAQKHYPEHTSEYHYTNIHLAETPEHLFQAFNTAAAQYPNSALLWYIFVRKLMDFELLTERRSHKLLLEIMRRKKNLLISKDLILLLIGSIHTVNGIEQFIAALENANLLKQFENSILRRYMALLFKHGLEISVHKPYMDKIVHNPSNIACARHLYKYRAWKTISCVGVMLNGEVDHQPENIYNMYRRELIGLSLSQNESRDRRDSEHDRQEPATNEYEPFCLPESTLPICPNEACLVALLRASIKGGNLLLWGKLYALQVAVHEFKKYVCSDSARSNRPCIVPSNRLWRVYLWALESAGYMLELADIIRWWEAISFVPNQKTLLLLLLMLPEEVAARHLKHAAAIPVGANLMWPWPKPEQVVAARQSKR